MANSPAAVIAAKKNHAPHLTPVMKSPIATPLNRCDHKYHSPLLHGHNTTETFPLRPLKAIIDHRNDDPDLGGIGGMGTKIGAGLSRTRTGPNLCTK